VGAALEVADEDEVWAAGTEGCTAKEQRSNQPPHQLAGLHQFSTQDLPRVVHAKASTPKQPPLPACAPCGGSGRQHDVLGVGWGMGAVSVGGVREAGQQPVAQQPPQQQQHCPQPHAAPSSKALRPSSSLGEHQSSRNVWRWLWHSCNLRHHQHDFTAA